MNFLKSIQGTHSKSLFYAVMICFFLFRLSFAQDAPGAPGTAPTWAAPNKWAVGTSYESYDLDGHYSGLSSTAPISKVWFTVAQGILTETYFPTVDTAQSQQTQLFITDGKTFVEEEKNGFHEISFPEPKAPWIRITTRDRKARYTIIKEFFTHPEKNIVLIQYTIESHLPDLKFYLSHHPRVSNTGYHNSGKIDGLWISYADPYVCALASSIPFLKSTVGFMSTSDGETQLKQTYALNKTYTTATEGHIGFFGELAPGISSFTVALSFAQSKDEVISLSKEIFKEDINRIKNQYALEWKSYFKPLLDLSSLSLDHGNTFFLSALMLKTHEDKTVPGAIVASLSIPWGDQNPESLQNIWQKQTISPLYSQARGTGGYHLIWPRDLFQVSRGLMAIHDYDTPKSALRFLKKIQYTSNSGQWQYGPRIMEKEGAFPQNTWADGTPFWEGLQMDETAEPIILAWHLWKAGQIDLPEFWPMVESAANFINRYGPWTAQERWEENYGISPSTIACEISALICASDMAMAYGKLESAAQWQNTADHWSLKPNDNIEAWTFTTSGLWGNGKYYLRLDGASPLSSTEPDYLATWDPNDQKKITLANFSGSFFEKEIVDAGFLELVRYGVRSSTNKFILESLPEIDEKIKVITPHGPAWYRYLYDGYGEEGRGRLWTFLTGERAQFELALLLKRKSNPKVIVATLDRYIQTLESFANEGHLFSEQIWDKSTQLGLPTGSATPLLWTHAEYLKLLRSKSELSPFDLIPIVSQRYESY